MALPLVLAGVLAAQDPPAKPGKGKPPVEEDTPKKKKPPVEEEDSPKPPNKKPPVEDDDTSKPKKPVPKDDDEGPSKNTKPIEKPSVPAKPAAPTIAVKQFDFGKEAAIAVHPEVKKLYQLVAVQADRILLKSDMNLTPVEPLPIYIGSKANTGDISYRIFGPDGKLSAAGYTVHPGAIVRGVTYEEWAIEEVSNFLIEMEKYADGNPKFLPRQECLSIADNALTAALQFHDKGREKKDGPGWQGVRAHLMDKYLDVLTDELNENISLASDAKAANRAADIADRMNTLFPDSLQAQREFVIWQLSLVDNNLSKLDSVYIKATKKKLKELEGRFPTADPKVLEKLRDRLRRRAQAHFDEARKLAATNDGKPESLRQLDMALKIWENVPGLRDFQQQLGHDFKMLVIGVNRLPELMSPALAITDADRWACDLLFESLVKAVPDGLVGHRYTAGLAMRLPRTIAMGREFELPRDAVWVDREGKTDKLDSSDVRGTLSMLQDKDNINLPVGENIDLLSEPVVQDAYRFPLRLERGCLDPLSVMSFKILPARLLGTRPDKMLNREFALDPTGSGPFVYHGRRTEDGREYAVFKANPNYGKRDGRFGLPRIQEIRFVVPPADPVADLREGRIDMLLDIPTSQMMRLRDPKNELAMSTADYTLNSRRIWMVAVNHRIPFLGEGDSAKASAMRSRTALTGRRS